MKYFQCGRFRYPLSGAQSRTLVMGVLNITPDSFSDGGKYLHLESAIARAEQMIEDGVDIIDIGGESSRPGSAPLALDEELGRVMPVIYALRDCGKPLSIDTYKPQVMREALLAGVDMINDIQGFCSPDAIAAVQNADAALCAMHMQNTPTDMQISPEYADVNQEVKVFLRERLAAFEQAGIEAERICLDPGFGFGKTLEHNVAMFRHLPELQQELGLPVLVGVSRKSMIGGLTGRAAPERLAGSVAAALVAKQMGANIIRVHDVAETVDAYKVWDALSR
ncbi:dihydropteroate synthase [Undibacterium umbellatum]|uniref:Dihydropteroate synthase n=1 Tax=Undibacterium umbellatum TaxID=2762300 RepID=A0ABR6Z4F3_9BURK|nr:dihydropteroate synthase [Undibacterium umbellatum]MBC3906509.1 dihydropteroate synthase [Undibacterium umbellatum]